MSSFTLTDEQLAVVHHDPSRHATVLAVAGAGKTTAMTHRVVHLTQACDVPPARIRALMFNRDARLAFQTQLRALDMHQVEVRTFHSMAHKLVEHLARTGTTPTEEYLSTEAGKLILSKLET
jgi:DNA helicase-2/ATP-dependent DNA helicase PcrA